jgi:hypothetical protein
MPRLLPEELALLNLEGTEFAEGSRGWMSKERARERLVELTGVDFGQDVEAWRRYLRQHGLVSEDFGTARDREDER